MTEALDTTDARFVEAFVRTGSAPEACEAAGISPRKAKQMMGNPDIQRAIAARTAPSDSEKPAGEVSLDSLIADARAAYAVAKTECNASAMVSAATLLARLTNRLDGAAKELQDEITEPPDNRDMSRAIIEVLQSSAANHGWQFGFAGPGERLIRVPASLAHTVGGAPAYAMPPGDDQPVNELTPAEPPSDSELALAIARALGPNALAVLEAATQSNGAGVSPDAATAPSRCNEPPARQEPFSGDAS